MKPPFRGEFVIDDISPSGFGSELVITIEEADGSKRSFTQPFSSVVQMQRLAWVVGISVPVKLLMTACDPNLIWGKPLITMV